MKKIIIDTNFLLIPYQFKVDIFSEISRVCSFSYELYIVDKTIQELEKIVNKQTGKNRKAAALGMIFLGQRIKGRIKAGELTVDEAILKQASKSKGCIVATQDAELKRKLKKKGVSLIVLKNKAYLEIIGH